MEKKIERQGRARSYTEIGRMNIAINEQGRGKCIQQYRVRRAMVKQL